MAQASIWDVAVREHGRFAQGKGRSSGEDGEPTLFFIGSKSSGKTTLISRFLDRDEVAKATTALEYTYGRKATGANMARDVAHIWELGGGTFLSQLVEIPISSQSLRGSLSVIIVLDLSRPQELWTTLEVLLKEVRSEVDKAMVELRAQNPSAHEQLKRNSWKKFGENHPDKDLLTPFPITLVMMGSKYDVFRNLDSEKRKVICKSLRFIAHTNGATLQFCSTISEGLVLRARSLLSSLAFGTTSSRAVSLDHEKPLLVPAGSDSIGAIGAPPLPSGDLTKIQAKKPYDLWKKAYTAFFPQEASDTGRSTGDPGKNPQYAERAVDSMRAQKDEELEQYRRASAAAARNEARRAHAAGQTSQSSSGAASSDKPTRHSKLIPGRHG